MSKLLTSRSVFAIVVALVAGASTANVAKAQGAVSGQITMLERPGESTTDLGNTVIYLVPAKPHRDTLAATDGQMAMQGRQFTPRVQVITAGGKVTFPNQDGFSHNIFANTPGAMFDLGLYGRGVAKDATFKKAGTFPIYCNIHPRMTGYVIALATPHYTQAGVDGRFTLPKVPAGTYTVHFWHERAPEVTRELVVAANGAVAVDTQLDSRGYKFVAHKNKFGQEYTKGKDRY